MSIEISDITPLNQFIATNLQTVFNVTWTADVIGDVRVYARATGTTSSDIDDLIDPSNYTTTLVGGTEAVRVTFAVGRTTGDIVTITRDTPATRDNLYINTNFTPTMLNGDFKRSTLIEQQNEMYHTNIGPRYNVSATLEPSGGANPGSVDRILPILGVSQIWAKNSAGTAIEVLDVPTGGGGLGPKNATYITQTPSADLSNEQALNALGTGLMSSTTTTGVVTTSTLTGTSSEVNIANGTGVGGNPTVSLSATLDTPGTFTVGTSVVIDSIINDSTMGTSAANNVSTSAAMKTYVDNQLGTSVPLTTKGDLLGFTTVDVRIPVGTTNGMTLQVASGAAAGVAWSTATYPTTATNAGRILRSNGTNYVDSTSSFADTYAASTLLYSNTANTVEGLATANSAMLVTNAAGVPAMSASLTNGQLMIGSTGATPTPSTLTAGLGITIVNTAATVTISSIGGGYSWTEVTGTTQAVAVNNGYILNNAGLITATMPAAAAVGDTFMFQGKGAGLFRIAQNAGQTIHFGSSDTTTGTGGYLEATNQYDSIELICITANTDFAVLTGSQGNLTIV